MRDFVFIFVFLGFIGFRGLSQDIDNDTPLPPTYFFDMLTGADSTTFVQEIEYPLLLIFGDDEKEQYSELGSIPEQKAYVERYVRRKNQNPIFPVNQWLLEFWGRYSYARKNFSMTRPPYVDGRGICCIKYGIPNDRYRDPGGLKFIWLFQDPVAFEALKMLYGKTIPLAEFIVRQNETWYYFDENRDFVVHFIKEGEGYRQVESLKEALHSSREQNIAWQWMELVKERETISGDFARMGDVIRRFEEIIRGAEIDEYGDIYFPLDLRNEISITRPHWQMYETRREMEFVERTARLNVDPDMSRRYDERNTLDFSFDVAQFKHKSGKTRVELVPLIPMDKLVKYHLRPTPPDTIKIAYQFMFRDEEFKPYMRIGFEDNCLYRRLTEAGLNNAMCRVAVPVEPVKGDLTIQITDIISSNLGFQQRDLEIRDFTGNGLMISDIQLYKMVADEGLKSILPVSDVEGIAVFPYPYRTIRKTEPLTCYFEIYNLLSLRPSATYEMEITLAHEDSRKGLRQLLSQDQEYEISTVHIREIATNDSHELIALDLGKLRDGEYTLEISVVHPESKNIVASTQKTVMIKD